MYQEKIMSVNRWLEPALEVGIVSNIEPWRVKVNLYLAGKKSSTFFQGKRYGLGEVGEFVLIESESNAILGRILECRLPERERLGVDQNTYKNNDVNPIGIVQLLGTYDQLTEKLKAGVRQYPRIGARVFSAPHEFLSLIPMKLEPGDTPVTIHLGHIKGASDASVQVTPERIFGRHCAVLGATGGGKSYTLARIISQCARYHAKVVLLDATGEYKALSDEEVCHAEVLGNQESPGAGIFTIPYEQLTEGDFVALFQPSGKVQGPKLREAIRSLRLVKIKPDLASNGVLKKCKSEKKKVLDSMNDPEVKRSVETPSTEFDVTKLSEQIREECVWENNAEWVDKKKVDKPTEWGDYDDGNYSYCLSLVNRINAIQHSPELKCLFQNGSDLLLKTQDFLKQDVQRILRISLEYLSFSFNAREIIANAIGRWFLEQARQHRFRNQPLVLILDEAHQFLNKHIGFDESLIQLDAFELLAKEGRKYGLNICLATQRPRDLPEGVLSQMGTLIVHRLTNDRDREIVERACGEIDRSASYFLPSLEPGEAALIGVDFPIPLTIQIDMPPTPPESTGPDYQKYWDKKD